MSTSGPASSIGRKALVGVPAVLAVASGVYALITRWQGQPPILCAIFGLLAVLIGFVTIRAVTDMPTVLRIVAIAGTARRRSGHAAVPLPVRHLRRPPNADTAGLVQRAVKSPPGRRSPPH